MLFRTQSQKLDLEWSWHRGDRAFFQAGACHILADAFLRRYPGSKFRPLLIQPLPGFRGSHIVAASPTVVFDWHGFSERATFLTHYFRKLRRFFPGWDATLVEPASFMSSEFFARYDHRAPHQFLHDPTIRAEAFVTRLVSRAQTVGPALHCQHTKPT